MVHSGQELLGNGANVPGPKRAVEWASQGGLNGNTLIDKLHMISALPCVEEIVSNDNFFHKVYPARQKAGHARAKLLKNDEFFMRF